LDSTLEAVLVALGITLTLVPWALLYTAVGTINRLNKANAQMKLASDQLIMEQAKTTSLLEEYKRALEEVEASLQEAYNLTIAWKAAYTALQDQCRKRGLPVLALTPNEPSVTGDVG
jgi:hypothetical protein